MGLFSNTLTDIKDKYILDVEQQRENAASLIIGNRGITNFRTNMERIGIKGGVLVASLENGFFESNLRNNPINVNYIYYRPEVKEPIEGINFSQTSDTLLLGTPYAYHERPLKNKTNLPLGEIDFLKKGDKRELWSVDSKQHNSETIKGIFDEFSERFKNNKEYGTINSLNDFYTESGFNENEDSSVIGTSNDFPVTVFTNGYVPEKKNILNKTHELFISGQIHSLISRFYDTDENNEKISRGRNLKKKGDSTTDGGYDNPYCRVWTAKHQYSKLSHLMRSYTDEDDIRTDFKWESLRPNKGALHLKNNSVLNSSGFVKISPNKSENRGNDLKKYMFSIENLAWKDVIKKEGILSQEQIGPNEGRIMWFPPYNLKFTENINVDWNQNEFIGRGEKIYTYKNTERNGTLSFTLLIDHPSLLNKWNDAQSGDTDKIDEDILRFFAGCGKFEYSPIEESVDDTPDENTSDNLNANPTPTNNIEKYSLMIFFPNNFSSIDLKDGSAEEIINSFQGYERSDSGEIDNITDKEYEDEILMEKNKKDKNRFNLNNFSKISELKKDIKDDILKTFGLNEDKNVASLLVPGIIDTYRGFLQDKKVSMKVSGYASSHGDNKNNLTLAQNRARMAINIFDKLIGPNSRFDIGSYITRPQILPVSTTSVNDLDAKLARCAVITFTVENNNKEVSNSMSVESINNLSGLDLVTEKSTNLNYYKKSESREDIEKHSPDNEYLYFKKIESEAPLYYKAITEKIRYFSPAYHSITPEGFNARLTFLNQCTRQGPTYSGSDGKSNGSSSNYLKYAGNLAFGRAPYCILRIGDFFYTKICIDSISIDYNNGDGVQWDLNHEGAGVQPMMANINMNFKFLGGQDISGPIERLQNAVTANYYANASVYDRHADTDTHYYDVWTDDKNNNNGRKEITNK